MKINKSVQLVFLRRLSVILCAAALLSACGKEKETDTYSLIEPIPAVTEDSPQQENMSTVPEESSMEPEDSTTEPEVNPPEPEDSPSEPEDSSSAPVEYETADGFMSSFLLASDRDMIDTTNDYGEFYRVVYEASLEGNELLACGSMDYRNFKEQDRLYVSSDLSHVFTVDDNTVYQVGGEESTRTVSKEEFAEYLESRKDSGMYLEVEISGGVVATAYLAAQ